MRECNVKNAANVAVQIVVCFLLIVSARPVFGQPAVQIKDSVPQHIFSYKEIEQLEDPSAKLQIGDVIKLKDEFKPSTVYTPKTFNLNSAYWFRIKIKFQPQSNQNWILEFFDQTIDDITLFEPIAGNGFRKFHFGDKYKFSRREYTHKNFIFDLSNKTEEEKTFYIRIQSSQSASIIVVLRSLKWFSEYATEEYLFFGLFYGMIAVFGFYNLLMFFAVRQKQYLYYVLYNLSIGLYEMCVDGIAFQYLWPNSPAFNNYSYGIALYLSSICGLLFTLNFLYLRSKSPVWYKAVLGVIAFRTVFLIVCLFNQRLFTYKIVEIAPLLVALFAGITVWRKGYKPARFFVAGYSFLLLGFIIKILALFDVSWMYNGPITYYSLGICFVVEMVLVSFAIGDKIRHLRKRKDKAQKRMIYQFQVNEKLKDTLTRELSTLVDRRTHEVVEKAKIIEQKNAELSAVNELLQKQAEEISRMNLLLEKDNQELTVNIEKVTRARVMSLEVDFEEFSKIYPDRETCFKYLSGLKWDKGYSCRKCGNSNFHEGQLPYSRRCTKCRYEESVIANTIFQNSRIPINKAFYMLFLIYSTKGKISSHKLSEILSIRQSTCWAYGSRMKKAMEERKRELKNAGEKGWSKLVLEIQE